MPRRKKPRLEGAEAQRALNRKRSAEADVYSGLAPPSGIEPFADEDGPEPIDLSAPRLANPVPGDDGAALLRIRDYFIAKHPDDWEAWKLCPLQHGLEAMAGKLRGS